jgi:hypothetical protein
MRRRSCSSLLAILLLILYSAPASWGQTSAIAAKAVVDQSMRPQSQSLAWAGSTNPLPRPPTHPGPVSTPGSAPTFQQLARAAGTIFAGTVTGIEPGAAAGGSAVPTVAVTFRVQLPLRGAATGGSLTILEWLGLWSSGQRYVVGEHVLLFLYPPSKLGLSSAVGGSLGQFRLDLEGRILLSQQQLAAFKADPLLAGRSRIALNDFAQALRQAVGEREAE